MRSTDSKKFFNSGWDFYILTLYKVQRFSGEKIQNDPIRTVRGVVIQQNPVITGMKAGILKVCVLIFLVSKRNKSK